MVSTRRAAAVALLLALVAAGSVAEARQHRASLKRAGLELTRALVAGDVAKAKTFMPSHAELAALTRKAPPKRRYRELVDRWVRKRVRELAEGKKQGKRVDVGEVRVRDVHILDSGSKLLRRVVFATVRVSLRVDGKERGGIELFFVDVGRRWKLSIKK
ncbi:MAG: hypothetical protein KC503_24870 [Myxococcales bacterium]|nr:hypothetical protein [Myxococcales bacterium]